MSHVADLGQALSEFLRVLRPNGHLVISDSRGLIGDIGLPLVRVGPSSEFGYMPIWSRLASDYLAAALPLGLHVRRCEEPRRPSPLVGDDGTDLYDGVRPPDHVAGNPPNIWSLHALPPPLRTLPGEEIPLRSSGTSSLPRSEGQPEGTSGRSGIRIDSPLGRANRIHPSLRLGVRMMARMHIDELEIHEALARRLLDEQFPEWADLPLRRVEPAGTVNAIFRLGGELSLRFSRREGPTEPGGKEVDWLPRLSPLLPLEIPVPVAQGRPTSEYPWFWDIYTWVEGETTPVEEIDAIQAARDLAAFVAELQQVDPAGAPPGRGIPLAERDKEIRYWLARFDGDPAVSADWERALAAPPWEDPPVWHHGDLDVRNWLVRDGRVSGVIDWGSMGVGDPACDVMVAWKLHSSAARDAFREALPTDGATWERARGWVLSQAIAALAYYTPENNPTLYHEAETWLELVAPGSAPPRKSGDSSHA